MSVIPIQVASSWNTEGFVASLEGITSQSRISLIQEAHARALAVGAIAAETWDGVECSAKALIGIPASVVEGGARWVGFADRTKPKGYEFIVEMQRVAKALKYFTAAVCTTAATLIPVVLVFPRIAVWIHDACGLSAYRTQVAKVTGLRAQLAVWAEIARESTLHAFHAVSGAVEKNPKPFLATSAVVATIAGLGAWLMMPSAPGGTIGTADPLNDVAPPTTGQAQLASEPFFPEVELARNHPISLLDSSVPKTLVPSKPLAIAPSAFWDIKVLVSNWTQPVTPMLGFGERPPLRIVNGSVNELDVCSSNFTVYPWASRPYVPVTSLLADTHDEKLTAQSQVYIDTWGNATKASETGKNALGIPLEVIDKVNSVAFSVSTWVGNLLTTTKAKA